MYHLIALKLVGYHCICYLNMFSIIPRPITNTSQFFIFLVKPFNSRSCVTTNHFLVFANYTLWHCGCIEESRKAALYRGNLLIGQVVAKQSGGVCGHFEVTFFRSHWVDTRKSNRPSWRFCLYLYNESILTSSSFGFACQIIKLLWAYKKMNEIRKTFSRTNESCLKWV